MSETGVCEHGKSVDKFCLYCEGVVNHQTIQTIGLLDRALSELKLLALSDIDAADIQTVKHHAEDCVGLGNRVLQILSDKQRERNAALREDQK